MAPKSKGAAFLASTKVVADLRWLGALSDAMHTQQALVENTKIFFDLHWGVPQKYPVWNFSWDWNSSLPNGDQGGVYALFIDQHLAYIGLGISKGGGAYADCGLTRRLMAHVFKRAPSGSDKHYMPREKWQVLGVNKIATLGFPQDLNYLAAALEDYLIGKLNPDGNQVKKSLS